jgi:very-short-patch-repair endonuclease
VKRSRFLRQNPSLAERILWPRLRRLKPQGLHFRRQVPVGRYIVDFACHSAKIVVELDGSQHGEPVQSARDEARTKFLESQGYRVLRFWNADVLRDSIAVAETIFVQAQARAHARIAKRFQTGSRE